MTCMRRIVGLEEYVLSAKVFVYSRFSVRLYNCICRLRNCTLSFKVIQGFSVGFRLGHALFVHIYQYLKYTFSPSSQLRVRLSETIRLGI